MEKLPFADLCSDEGGKLIAGSHNRLIIRRRQTQKHLCHRFFDHE